MTGAAHVLVGAAVGHCTGHPVAAFAAGVASHALGDLLPHRDFDLALEAPLTAAALVAIGAWHGFDSPAFAGAIGAVLPDVENAAEKLGLIPPERLRFPTHNGRWPHGRAIRSLANQVLLGAAAVALLAAARPRRRRE